MFVFSYQQNVSGLQHNKKTLLITKAQRRYSLFHFFDLKK